MEEDEENDAGRFGFGDQFVDDSKHDEVGNESFDDFGAGFQKLNEDGGAFGGFGGEEDFEQFKAAPPPPTDSAGQIHSPRPPPSSPNGALARNGDHQRIMVPNGSPVPLVKFKRATSNGLDQPKPGKPRPVKKAPHIAIRQGSGPKKPPPKPAKGPVAKPIISAPLRNAPIGLAKSIAINVNKNITKVSQPFTCGYDMTTNEQLDAQGLCLRRIFLNCMMVFPGSFSVAIRTEPNGKGDVMAKEKGISATATFNQTVIDFSNQPFLTMGKIYYYHIVLECGAFKFQGAPVAGKAGMHKYDAYRRKEKLWLKTQTSFVTKPVFRKAMPKRGDRCGYLLVISKPRAQKKEKKRSAFRWGKPVAGVRKFVVLEDGLVKCYADIDGLHEFSVPMQEIVYIESKGGAIDTKEFSLTTRSAELQFAATSATECSKWIKSLEKLHSVADRRFGDSATTGMMF